MTLYKYVSIDLLLLRETDKAVFPEQKESFYAKIFSQYITGHGG